MKSDKSIEVDVIVPIVLILCQRCAKLITHHSVAQRDFSINIADMNNNNHDKMPIQISIHCKYTIMSAK